MAFALYRAEMNEYIFTILTRDETKAFSCIEPLDGTAFLTIRDSCFRA